MDLQKVQYEESIVVGWPATCIVKCSLTMACSSDHHWPWFQAASSYTTAPCEGEYLAAHDSKPWNEEKPRVSNDTNQRHSLVGQSYISRRTCSSVHIPAAKPSCLDVSLARVPLFMVKWAVLAWMNHITSGYVPLEWVVLCHFLWSGESGAHMSE